MVKNAIQSLWKHRCKIIVYENKFEPSINLTVPTQRVLKEDVPCHLRFYYYMKEATDEENSRASQRASLFVDREIDIPPGSKVVVNLGDYTEEFEYAGLPFVYTYHKEVPLAVLNRRI